MSTPHPDEAIYDHASPVLIAARLAAIVESSDDAIVSKTLDGTILSWNATAERIFGYSATDMIGSSIYTLIPPGLYDEERNILARVARGEHIVHYETIRIAKDGSIIPIDLTISPLLSPTGVVVGISSIKHDLSERRRAMETAARLTAIVESSHDAIVSKTLDGTILSWNSAAEHMYGYTAAEMIGQSIYLVVPEGLKGEEQEILDRVTRGEHVAHYETIRRRKDGAEINIGLTVSPVRDPTGTIIGASSIKRDITERKRAEETRRQAVKMEAIGRLAGGLAHDFNNQLHALSGFANFVARDPSLSGAARQDIVEILNAAERMASLTRQLLAFARQQVLSPETLDLNAAVADAQPMLQRLIGSNMEMSLVRAPGFMWVRLDRAQLVQVLMNLAINARDAMPRGGQLVLQTKALNVSAGQLLDRTGALVEPGVYTELTLADTGEGIPPEQLGRIFEPFYTTKDVGQGTGLGLATVEGIVSQSGGHIQVESVVDKGTTFRILFPLTMAPEPPAPVTSPAIPTVPQSPQRVLVVDDEDLVRMVVVRTLQEHGYETLQARHGREAIDCLEQVGGAIDLVMTDLVMPVMDGRELAKELALRYPAVPLVWMSGYPREIGLADRDPGRDEPFLHKPVRSDLLLRTVAQVLQRQSSCR